MSKIKNYLLGALCTVATLPGTLLAEGESPNNWDFTAVGAEVNNMGTAYKTFVTTYMIPAAVMIVAAGVILWVLVRAPRAAGLGKK